MDYKKEAEDLIKQHYVIIFNHECDCSEEIVITQLAKEHALVTINNIIKIAYWEYMESSGKKEKEYLLNVKQEIEKY